MQIDERTLKQWKSLYDRGDAAKLAESAGVHKNTVFNAFKTGRTNSRLYRQMLILYSERRTQLEAAMLGSAVANNSHHHHNVTP